MATRRRNSTKSKAKQPKQQAKAGTPRRGGASRKRASGTRKARSTTAARNAAARATAARRADEAAAAAPPVLRVAEPPAVDEHDADWGGQGTEEPARTNGSATSWGTAETHHAAEDREAAEIARRIEEAAGTASDDFARRADAAARELGLRREADERDADALRMEEQRGAMPGFAALGIELAVGALRIARALATAPLRIGLAFLRR